MAEEKIQFKLSEIRKNKPERSLLMAQDYVVCHLDPLCFPLGMQKDGISQTSLSSVGREAIRMK